MRTLVVDDHQIVREGLAAVLESIAPDVRVVHAADAQAAVAAVREQAFDVVFLDLTLAAESGYGVLDALRRERPATPVIIFSSSEAGDDVRMTMARGARGYLPKSASVPTIRAALSLVLAGEVYVPPLLASEPTSARDALGLTERQLDVLRLIAADLPNGEIAYRLGISEKTVKAHITVIFRALGVFNRMQAARAARAAALL